jgi:hypothetical protein
VTTPDPFAVLGLPPGATAGDIAAARRRLAKSLHPDLAANDGRRMQEVNDAAAAALSLAGDAEVEFALDVLPVEACQRLLVAVASLGEVVDADEPYRIEGWMPPSTFYTVELLPEAGGTMVRVAADVAAALIAELP